MSAGAFLKARVPALAWVPAYDRSFLRADAVAGLTTASVIIPKAMAYATLAGLAVQVGLYTALLPLAAYVLLGTSRVLSVTTTTTIGILTASEIARVAPTLPGADPAVIATSLAVLVGIVLVAASLFRLGFVAQFISEPVLTGFKAGIGLVIVVDQLPKLFGLHIPKGSLLGTITALLHALPERSQLTLVVAVVTIVGMVALERLLPRAPAPLIAVAGGIAASGLLGLSSRGVETIGRIPAGLPLPVLPDTSLFQTLWPGALGIALMCFTESIASGRAFARQGDRRPDADQELLALGVGNVLGGLFGAMPAGGGTSQTAVNAGAGARSQVSSLVTAIATLLVIVFLAPLLALMPQATLAAVVIVTSVGLINPADLMAIRHVRTLEFRWALAAMLGVVILGTLPGILAAVILSMVSLLRQANFPAVHVLGQKPGTEVFRPRSADHPEDLSWPGLLLVRPEGRIYFANAQRVVDRVLAHVHATGAHVVVLDLSAVPDIEYTGLKSLTDLERSLAESSVVLFLAALNPAPLSVVQRSSLGARLGRERMFFTVGQAVTQAGSRAPA
jgi:high affinity sulfate transporter 1